MSNLDDIFQAVRDPFNNYSSEYLRMKNCIAKGLINPQELTIGSRLDTDASGTRTVGSTVQYVPLCETIDMLYSKSEFRDSLKRSR